LLKTGVGYDRYVLVSDTAGRLVTLPMELSSSPHTETYEGVGPIGSDVYAFSVEALLEDDAHPQTGTPEKLSDAARKLVEGLRGIGHLARRRSGRATAESGR
jgi:hypothetical protein